MKNIVNEGVVAFADAEQRAEKAAAKVLALQAIFRAGNEAGMMGLLQTNAMCAKARAAAGFIAHAEAIVAELHIEATNIAIKCGCDVPEPRSGGGGR